MPRSRHVKRSYRPHPTRPKLQQICPLLSGCRPGRLRPAASSDQGRVLNERPTLPSCIFAMLSTGLRRGSRTPPSVLLGQGATKLKRRGFVSRFFERESLLLFCFYLALIHD